MMNLNRLKINDPTMKILEDVKNRIKFDSWYFGHFHKDLNFDNKFFCLYNQLIKL
jgi:hypothetical protein